VVVVEGVVAEVVVGEVCVRPSSGSAQLFFFFFSLK